MKALRDGFFSNECELKAHPTLPVVCSVDGQVFRLPSMKPIKTTRVRGYLQTSVCNRCMRVHRLIAETFIPNPQNKPTVDHINRIRDDNRLCNLRWATHTEQRDNSSQVLNAKNYGVRSCVDRKAYNNAEAKDWYQRHKEHRKEYMRNYYLTHKEKWVS